MSAPPSDPAPVEPPPEVLHILEGYLEELERGGGVLPDELLARHPDLEEPLRACLAGLAFLHEAALGLRAPAERVSGGPPLGPPAGAAEIGRLGDFRLLREVGRGGMGVVYEAEQVSLGRRVALKVLPFAAALDARSRQRFHNEAQTAGQLHHPNIVPVYAVGAERGVHYYAMQYVEGQALAGVIDGLRRGRDPTASGPAPPQARSASEGTFPSLALRACEAATVAGAAPTTPLAALSTEPVGEHPEFFRAVARLGVQAAEALDYAHQLGVVHRDVKPANLLVDGHGVWVTDFGLALCQNNAALTLTGDLVGTLRYMSPEQALGRRAVVDHRTDVYSLGISLYELLTLEPAFDGQDRRELLRQIAEEEPRPSRRLNRAVPAELEKVVRKAAAKEPGFRYATAQDFADDLSRFLEGKPVRARPPGLLERASLWARRHRALVLAGAALLVIALVGISAGAALVWQQKERAERALAEADQQRAIAEQQRRRAEEVAREYRRASYAAHLGLAQQAWDNLDVRQVRDLLAGYVPRAHAEEDLRGFEWHYLWRRCHRERATLRGHTGAVYFAAVSPDRRTLATASEDATVRLWDLPAGRERAVLRGHAGEVNWAAFSPGGDTLASAGDDGAVRLWDVASRRERAALRGHTGPVVADLFCPDGRTLATGGEDRLVQLWDVAAGRARATLRGHEHRIEGLAISPDGRALASASKDATVRLWDVDQALPSLVLRGHANWVVAVAFAPDGKRLASASVDQTVKLWDAVGGRELATLRGHRSWVRSVAFSPDGRLLASAGEDATVRLWEPSAGQLLDVFQGHEGRVWWVGFSRDGETLLTAGADQTVKFWDLAEGQAWVHLPEQTGPVLALAFSPDGRILATAADGEAVVRLWDVAHKPEAQARGPSPRWRFGLVCGHTAAVGAVAFSPDGKVLASASNDGTVRLWDAAAGLEHQVLRGHGDRALAVAFAPDGATVASGSRDRDVRLWDAATGTLRATLRGHTADVAALAFAPDGRTLASASHDGTVRLWDVVAQQPRAILRGHRAGAFCLAFAPDGRVLAAGGGDRTVRMWDARTGAAVAVLQGHGDAVGALGFSPDSRTLASGGDDRTVRLWHTATRQPLVVLKGHTGKVRCVTFAPDERTLATGGESADRKGEVYLWRAGGR